ncbi:MAG: CHAT domain-containing protein [Cyanothece sp. SIO1E1]|nr:CHAT domain-containing protein [Cyanothece sp. SIO1E1]
MRIANFFRLRAQQFLVGVALLTCCLVIMVSPVVAHQGPERSLEQPNLILHSAEITEAGSIAFESANPAAAQVRGTAPELIEQGKQLFAAGRLPAAVDIWQQAAKRYQLQGDRLGQARSLNYLSLAYLNLGYWEQADSAVTEGLTLLQSDNALSDEKTRLLAESLNTQGNIQLTFGQTEAALAIWQQAALNYKQIDDIYGQLGSQINQAKALQSLGNHRRSQKLLEQVLVQLKSQPDSAIKATSLRLLGVTLQAIGDLENAQARLEESLIIAQNLADHNSVFADQKTATLVSLGNTLAARQQVEAALTHYRQAAMAATYPLPQTEALLNQFRLLVQNQRWSQTQALLPQIQSNLLSLAPSRAAIYARVNFVDSWLELSAHTSYATPSYHTMGRFLAEAIQQAKILKDLRAEAYAMGALGHLYEGTQQWQEAKALTEQAILMLQQIQAPDILAPLHWQLGRIFKQQGQLSDAIAAYQQAVDTLQSLRQELVALAPEFQFSFTEKIEPIYREFVTLLLDTNPSQAHLQQARDLIETLQIAELDNYFREACLRVKPQQIDAIDPTAAVIYPIILPDRLAIIVSRAGQPLLHYQTAVSRTELEAVIEEFRLVLNPHFFVEDRLRLAQQLYDWLIKPAEAALNPDEVKTLVFVLDGSLRSLPMAALYDGHQYLIKKYGVALAPGLQLLEPRSLNTRKLRALTAGLSESRHGFYALPGVETEVNQIAAEVPSSVLLNQKFTIEQLQAKINSVPFPIVHLATHGQFSSKAEDTFLVTWDGEINVKNLSELLQARKLDLTNPLELLVLSACQTATGDKMAALGLAGLAVRSGARSTLATLWQVNDDSTATLMAEFYRNIIQQSGLNKAEALRAAQVKLLEESSYQDPFNWAAFVLVGNWL